MAAFSEGYYLNLAARILLTYYYDQIGWPPRAKVKTIDAQPNIPSKAIISNPSTIHLSLAKKCVKSIMVYQTNQIVISRETIEFIHYICREIYRTKGFFTLHELHDRTPEFYAQFNKTGSMRQTALLKESLLYDRDAKAWITNDRVSSFLVAVENKLFVLDAVKNSMHNVYSLLTKEEMKRYETS